MRASATTYTAGVRQRPLRPQHVCGRSMRPSRRGRHRGSRYADADRAFLPSTFSVGGCRPRAGEARPAPVPLGPPTRLPHLSGAHESVGRAVRGRATPTCWPPLRACVPGPERSVRIRISCHYWERQVARNALAGRRVGDGASSWRQRCGAGGVVGMGSGSELWGRRRHPGFLVQSGWATSAVGMGPWRREAAKCVHVPGNAPPYL